MVCEYPRKGLKLNRGIVIKGVLLVIIEQIGDHVHNTLQNCKVVREGESCIKVAGNISNPKMINRAFVLPDIRWRIQFASQRRQVGNTKCVLTRRSYR